MGHQSRKDSTDRDDLHKNHRQRMKQEFRDVGMEHWPSHKILEFLLFVSIPRRDTNPTAHELMERFGSLSGVLDAPYDMLLEVDGVSQEVATNLKFTQELIKFYMVDKYSATNVINSTQEAIDYFKYRFLTDDREKVILVCLSPGGRILYSNTIAQGTLEKVDLVPSEVIKLCLRANAAKALLAHNHPDGLSLPSRKDKYVTHLLSQELARVDVELTDHIIVASDGALSMKDNGHFIPAIF